MLTIESSISLKLLLWDINFTRLLSLKTCRTFSLGNILRYAEKYQNRQSASFTLYMSSFSRYTTSSSIKFICGRIYSLPWLIIVWRYIAPVSSRRWLNNKHHLLRISFCTKAFNLISFNIGKLPDIVSMNSTLESVNGNIILFSPSPASNSSSFFSVPGIFFVSFRPRQKTVKITWRICVDFLLPLLEFPVEGEFFLYGWKSCWNHYVYEMMVSTLMFVIFAFELAILALVFAIFALGMIFALMVVFALRKMFDLVVVLLYFAPFDSQQIVFY